MNVHKNARLTPRGRERIVRQVESGQTPKAVAEAAGVCLRTARKWVDRYRREGLAGLQDRSSRPHSDPFANTRGCGRGDRTAAPAALDRQADRHTGRRLTPTFLLQCMSPEMAPGAPSQGDPLTSAYDGRAAMLCVQR